MYMYMCACKKMTHNLPSETCGLVTLFCFQKLQSQKVENVVRFEIAPLLAYAKMVQRYGGVGVGTSDIQSDYQADN